MNNLLNLSNPDEINCNLLSYSRGHSEMYIEVYIEERVQYIFLDGVKYFAGPTHWQGANFRLGTDQEFMAVANSFSYLQRVVNEHQNHHCVLYLISTQHGEDIQIIAYKEGLFLVTDLPEHLYGLRN